MTETMTYDPPARVFRYMMDDGRTIDVTTCHASSSDERAWVLKEAKRLWKRDFKIAGITEMKVEDAKIIFPAGEPRKGLFERGDLDA